MPQHNLLFDLLGTLALPLCILIPFAMLAGINPAPIASGYLKLVGTVAALLLRAFFQVVTLILGEVMKYIAQQRALSLQQNQPNRVDTNSDRRVRIHIRED